MTSDTIHQRRVGCKFWGSQKLHAPTNLALPGTCNTGQVMGVAHEIASRAPHVQTTVIKPHTTQSCASLSARNNQKSHVCSSHKPCHHHLHRPQISRFPLGVSIANGSNHRLPCVSCSEGVLVRVVRAGEFFELVLIPTLVLGVNSIPRRMGEWVGSISPPPPPFALESRCSGC